MEVSDSEASEVTAVAGVVPEELEIPAFAAASEPEVLPLDFLIDYELYAQGGASGPQADMADAEMSAWPPTFSGCKMALTDRSSPDASITVT